MDGAILRVTLARPDVHNAQTPAMWEALGQIGEDLPDDVRVVILSGDGPSFSAGLDRRMIVEGIPGQTSLAELSQVSDDEFDQAIATFQRGFRWWREKPVVTIAAVHGHAIGAGFQLALGCDLIVAAESASFAMKEVALGLVPDLGGTWPLTQLVGPQRALELCLTGRKVSGREAADIGIALARVPDEELSGAADDLAAGILAAMPNATTAVLELLRGAPARSYGDQLAAERKAQRTRILELAAMMKG